jgi:serine/threonine protein kinase
MFKFSKIIGKGGFGRVWKVTDKKTKNVYAMKVMGKAKILAKKSAGSIMN